MKWGTRLQDSIAKGIAQDNGWDITPMNEYIRDPDYKIGSSFDFAIGDEGLLEIKNVDALQYREKWSLEDGELEAPAHIELQVQHQLLVTGRKFAYIGALIGGNEVRLIKREPQPAVFKHIKAEVIAFWDSIEANEPPPPVFPDDAQFVSSLYGYASPGSVARANDEVTTMALQYGELTRDIKVLTENKETLKAKMMMQIGEAEKVLGDGFSISASVVGPTIVETYERKGYRLFRVNIKKGK